ncbi:MAG: serine hydrolase domain-containing protein [Pseudomonadota bacterium]
MTQHDMRGVLHNAVHDGTLKMACGWLANAHQVIFSEAAGEGQPRVPMTVETPAAIMSMTKAITGAAAMQLVEQGRLSLNAPAGEVCPYLAEVQVLDGYDADGQPKLRPPVRPVTLRNLLTHSSGFCYDIWNPELMEYLAASNTPSMMSLQKAALRMPLMFDPDSRWEYGIGIDWAGQMIEAVTGQTLGAYLAENLFEPLGMQTTTFAPDAATQAQQAAIYHRLPAGDLVLPESEPAPATPLPAPEFEMGGGGLISTVADYGRFLRMLLGGGELDGRRVLSADTVQTMAQNQMGDLRVTPLRTAMPPLSHDAEFFPGAPKSWGLTFQINEEPAATGRAAGTLMWAGLTNCYYWVDMKSQLAGLFLTQVLPFADPQSLSVLNDFETAAYQHVNAG